MSKNGVEIDPNKVKVVMDWKLPRNVTDVRAFLGFASYYRKHIRNFADIAKPLYRLTEKAITSTGFQNPTKHSKG